MREPAFIKQNVEKWKQFEQSIENTNNTMPDVQADLFIQLTDDLSYSKTFYPNSKVTAYLNTLTAKIHQIIYKNKKESYARIINFWRYELPTLFYNSHKQLFWSFIIFAIAAFIGVISSANDVAFSRLILGDDYVNMTLENISNNDPMGVYKSSSGNNMFALIPLHNIQVSFYTFILGIFGGIGTVYQLLLNGIMLGTFQYFFYEHGFFIDSLLSIWIHGTLEISSIIIAGCAGLVLGNSLLFPNTLSRYDSFVKGVKQGTKIIIGILPIFLVAGFLESYITRLTNLPNFVKLTIILSSLAFIIGYFIIYPIHLNKNKPLL